MCENEKKLVKVKIDGRDFTVPEGLYISQAAESVGVDIPVFCGFDKLKPWAGCRICLVEVGLPRTIEKDGERVTVVSKLPKLQAACATQVCEGMEIWTDTELVDANRKRVLEFLLINHPLECPECDKGGECLLQDIAYKYGLAESRMKEPKRVLPDADVNEFIRLNYKRCIHCKRCVRFHSEVAGDHLLEFARRGSETLVLPKADDGVKSKFSGNEGEFCPVGALSDKLYRFKAREWDLGYTPSVSLADATGTNIMLHHRQGRIKRVWSRENPEVDWGWLSDKDRFVYEALYSPNRIKKPLIRQKDGKFKEVAWGEAIRYVVDNLKFYIGRDGKESITGIAGGNLTNEVFAVFRRLLTNHIGTGRYHFGQFIPGISLNPGDFLTAIMFDSTSWEKVTHSDVILAWGVDLLEEAPVLALKIERDMENGGPMLITANSHRTSGERFANIKYHYPYRKQADALRIMINGAAKPADAPEEIKPMIEYLRGADTVAVLIGNEMLSAPNATELIDLMLKLCHNLRVKLGEDGDAAERDQGLTPDITFNPIFRDGNAVGALLFGHLMAVGVAHEKDEAEGAKPGLVRLFQDILAGKSNFCYVIGSDYARNFPDAKLTRNAFEKCEFVVVQDQFITETAKYANVILPALTAQEDEGTVFSGEKRLQRLHKPDVSFPQADSDFNILRKVLVEMGASLRTASVGEYFNHFAQGLQVISHIDYGAIPEDGILLEFGEVMEDGQSPDPGSFITVDAPSKLEEAAGKDDGLMVLIPKLYMFNGENHSMNAEHFAQAVGKAFCEISPTDAERLGIKPGSVVELASRAGGIEVEVRVSADVPPGHVLISDSLPGIRLADILTLGEHTVVNLLPVTGSKAGGSSSGAD